MLKDGFRKRSLGVFLSLGLSLVLSLALSSCSSGEKTISWNVELKESRLPITDKCAPNEKLRSVKSPEKPKVIPPTETLPARLRVVGVPCEKGEEPPIYYIPADRVKRVTYVADPLSPPVVAKIEDLPLMKGCCRLRDGFWFFDKFEIKGTLGYRGGSDEVSYPTPTGEKVYKSSLLGFDRGGSSLTIGLEVAGLWNVPKLDKTGKFQLGFLTGIWPQDESAFIPLGLYARYTFNQFPAKYSPDCGSWFLYGTAGLPLDFSSDAPLFGSSSEFQRYFYGGGIGYDFPISCDADFSVDFGIRQANLPLPPYSCCSNVPKDEKNPFRNSTVALLRFGLSF